MRIIICIIIETRFLHHEESFVFTDFPEMILYIHPRVHSLRQQDQNFFIQRYVHRTYMYMYFILSWISIYLCPFYTVTSWRARFSELLSSYLAGDLFVFRKKRNASPYLALKFFPVKHLIARYKRNRRRSLKSNIKRVNNVMTPLSSN